LFGFGVADGEARAEGALARALQSALLDKGHRLADADRLWIHVAGGEDMRWSEVQAIMTRASAQVSDHVRIFCGAAIDPALAGAISVTILAGVPDREFSTALADLDGEPGVGLATDYPPSEPGVLAYAGLHAEPAPSSQPQMETPLVDLASGHEQQVPMDPQFEIHAEEEPVPPEVFATESHVPFDAPPAPNPEWPADSGDDFAEVVHASFPADPAQDIRKENRVMEEGSPPVEAFANNRRSANPEPPKGVEQPGRLGGDASGSGAGAGSLENVRRENRQPSVGPEVHTEPPPPQPAQPAPATPNLTASPQGTQVVASPPAAPAESDPASKKKETVQEQMKFEPVNRGRFEKTDPTIVDGEDLDVPTFLRRRRDV
jgi:cell division protein FtsZ